MKKGQKVLLVAGKQKREFTFEHAEKILGHPSNLIKGKKIWTLPKDSTFEFVNNELNTKSDKGVTRKSGAQRTD